MTTWERLAGDRGNSVFGSFVFLFTLAVYTLTLTPTVPFWDSGEYIATSYILGIPHAPGTPLYVLLGRMFTLVPIGEIAQRVNWFSAVSSSVALLFIYLIGVKVTRKVFPWEENPVNRPLAYLSGVCGAVIAGFATTFWDNAIEAEVYAGSCALMAFVVWLVLRWHERLDEGTEDGLLLLITYLVGLGVGIHLGVAIAAWAAVVFVFMSRPKYLYRWDYLGWAFVTLSLATGIHKTAFMVAPAVLVLTLGVWLGTGKFRKLAFWSAVLFMVGLSVHFFLIIRSNLDPMINEAAPKTWDALWKMLIRDQYKPPPVWQRKADWIYQFDFMWLRYMWWNFSIMGERVGESYAFRDFLRGFLQPTILLAIAGTVVHFVRARRTGILLGILFLLCGPVMAVYINFAENEVRERDYFFVQNFMFMSIWAGIGAAWLADWVRRQFKNPGIQKTALWTAVLGVLVVSFMPLASNWQSHDRRGFNIAHNYAYNMLTPLEPNAIIFTNGDNDTFPLWYLQEVEGVRKDVRVVNLSLLNTDWYIKQLRDLKPTVPITWSDAQIARLRPVRTPDGRILIIKDLAVEHILTNNQWRQPAYLAVTVPDQMDLTDQLVMEGLVFRIHPEKQKQRIDVDKTLYNMDETYRYEGLVIRDPEGPAGFGYPDTTVFKTENAENLVQNYAAAYARAALGLVEQNRYEDALTQIIKAETVSSRFPGTFLAKGIILEQLKRFDEALAHYKSKLQIYPNDWQLTFRLAETLVQMGRLDESVPYFERSIQSVPPDQFYPYQGLTGAYYQMGEYQNAIRVLERWLIIHPEDGNVRPLYDELRQSLRQGTLGGATDSVPPPATP